MLEAYAVTAAGSLLLPESAGATFLAAALLRPHLIVILSLSISSPFAHA